MCSQWIHNIIRENTHSKNSKLEKKELLFFFVGYKSLYKEKRGNDNVDSKNVDYDNVD